jgi:hypothetical protein
MSAAEGSSRGNLKVYLGYAAGVGKTFQMLDEGQALHRKGVDVVVGYFEPHGRQDTIAKTEGLEMIPRRKVNYRDTFFEEMDTDAILQRRPQVEADLAVRRPVQSLVLGAGVQASSQPETCVPPGWSPIQKGLRRFCETSAHAALPAAATQGAKSECGASRLPPTAALSSSHCAGVGQYGSPGRTRSKGDMTRAASRAGRARPSGRAAPSFKRFLRCMARTLLWPPRCARSATVLDQPAAFTAAMSSPAAFCASPYSMRVLSR